MRVLGIDCGTEYTGYGVVDLVSDARNNDRLECIVCGAIKASPRDPMPTRLSHISIGLSELIARHRPDCVAIEDVFYATNVKSALKLGQVRGVAMLAAATAGLEVAGYSPLSIKSPSPPTPPMPSPSPSAISTPPPRANAKVPPADHRLAFHSNSGFIAAYAPTKLPPY